MIWYGIVLHWIIDQDSSICTISYHEEDVQFWNAFSLSLHRLYFATNLFYVALQSLNFSHICAMISFGGLFVYKTGEFNMIYALLLLITFVVIYALLGGPALTINSWLGDQNQFIQPGPSDPSDPFVSVRWCS